MRMSAKSSPSDSGLDSSPSRQPRSNQLMMRSNILVFSLATSTQSLRVVQPTILAALLRHKGLFVFVFCLFVSSSLIADGANQRATTLPIPHVVTRDLPISPRFTPTSFYRDAGSALLRLVNQWLNFSYSRPHAFRYGNQKKKFTPAESQTHKFRLSGHKLFPLVHGGSPCYNILMVVLLLLLILFPDGFLLCDHGLDFLRSANVRIQSINQTYAHLVGLYKFEFRVWGYSRCHMTV